MRSVPDMRPMFTDAMQIAKVEIGGTRTCLALAAQWINTGNMPTNIALIRPRWVDKLDTDFFDASRLRGNQPRFYFTIPMTDRRGLRPGETPKPMDMEILVPDSPNVSVPAARRSVRCCTRSGPIRRPGVVGRRVQNTAQKVENADYLIWPPVISLYRQNLVELGDLK